MQCPGSQEGALWFLGHREVLQLTPHPECKSWTPWGPQDHVLSCSHISPPPAVAPHLSSCLPTGFQPASHPQMQPSQGSMILPGAQQRPGCHVVMLTDATVASHRTELVDEFWQVCPPSWRCPIASTTWGGDVIPSRAPGSSGFIHGKENC